MVDGAARPGTVLALSHWPATPTPPEIARDLSTEIAYEYFRHPGLWTREAEVVTSDHFDEDGLASLFFVVEPEAALAHVGSLVGIARAGDFDVLDTVEAGRAVWALHALADPERSPFSPGAGERGAPPADWSSLVYAELLGRIVELIEHLDRFRQWWAEEDTSYRAGLAALSHGDLHIEEHPDLDLAVVRASAQLVPDRFAVDRPRRRAPGPSRGAPQRDPGDARARGTRPLVLLLRPLRDVGALRQPAPAAPARPRAAGGAAVRRGAARAPVGGRLARDARAGAAAAGRRRELDPARPARRARAGPPRVGAGRLGAVPRGRRLRGADAAGQCTGRFHRGNHRSRSGSMARSSARRAFSLSSPSLSRRSRPVGTKG